MLLCIFLKIQQINAIVEWVMPSWIIHMISEFSVVFVKEDYKRWRQCRNDVLNTSFGLFLKIISCLVHLCHFNGSDHHHHDSSLKQCGLKWLEWNEITPSSLSPSVTLFLSQRLNLFKSLSCIMFPIERAGFNWRHLFKGWGIDFQAWSTTSLM